MFPVHRTRFTPAKPQSAVSCTAALSGKYNTVKAGKARSIQPSLPSAHCGTVEKCK